MDIKTLIQPTARAIRVIDLQKGTVYKRVVKEYSETYKVTYGIVLDILHSSETFIDVLEIDKAYGGTKFNFTVLGNGSNLNLFPTTRAEIVEFLHSTKESVMQDIEEARENLAKKEAALKIFEDVTKDNFAQIKDTSFTTIEDHGDAEMPKLTEVFGE